MTNLSRTQAERDGEPGRRPRPAAQLHAVFDVAYRELAEQRPFDEILRSRCRAVAEMLGIPFVTLLMRHAAGSIELRVTSDETLLWSELLRIPERWDGTVAGNGPGARALRDGAPAIMAVDDPDYVPWRKAAERDGLSQIGAWPVAGSSPAHVLYAGTRDDRLVRDPVLAERLGEAAAEFGSLLAQATTREAQSLLAAALSQAGSASFITDIHGNIVWANAAFARLCGHRLEDVIGRNPRFLKSGEQTAGNYRDLWSTLRSGTVWNGPVIDRDGHGHTYKVLQTLTPFGMTGQVTHYLAIQNEARVYETQARERPPTLQMLGSDPIS